jgi:hypothetical protein
MDEEIINIIKQIKIIDERIRKNEKILKNNFLLKVDWHQKFIEGEINRDQYETAIVTYNFNNKKYDKILREDYFQRQIFKNQLVGMLGFEGAKNLFKQNYIWYDIDVMKPLPYFEYEKENIFLNNNWLNNNWRSYNKN